MPLHEASWQSAVGGLFSGAIKVGALQKRPTLFSVTLLEDELSTSNTEMLPRAKMNEPKGRAERPSTRLGTASHQAIPCEFLHAGFWWLLRILERIPQYCVCHRR